MLLHKLAYLHGVVFLAEVEVLHIVEILIQLLLGPRFDFVRVYVFF